MCGRVIQSSAPLRLAIVDGMDVSDSRLSNVITVPSNALVRQIHNRMPAILAPASYDRWLGPEPDPHDLLITYPAELMMMWPISTQVNKPENDDPALLECTVDPSDIWAPIRRVKSEQQG